MIPVGIYPKGQRSSSSPLSPAVVFHHIVFISGQVPVDAEGKTPSGIKAQTEVALKNLLAVVEAAGGSAASVLRCSCYLTNMDDFAAFNEVYRRFFTSTPLPARTTVGVSRLASPDFLVEVDAVAALVD